MRSPFEIKGLAEIINDLKNAPSASVSSDKNCPYQKLISFLLLKAFDMKNKKRGKGYVLDLNALKEIARGNGISLSACVFLILSGFFYSYTGLYNKTVVTYDLEATGLGLGDELTEIGAVKSKNGVITDEFQTLINPKRWIGPDIVELTGITNAMVKDAPSVKEASEKFLEFIKDAETIVVHNGGFDISAMRRRFWKFFNYDFNLPVMDTRNFVQSVVPLTTLDLGSLCNQFNIKLEGAHRAFNDAKATFLLFTRIYNLTSADLKVYLKRFFKYIGLLVYAEDFKSADDKILLYRFFSDKHNRRISGLEKIDLINAHDFKADLKELKIEDGKNIKTLQASYKIKEVNPGEKQIFPQMKASKLCGIFKDYFPLMADEALFMESSDLGNGVSERIHLKPVFGYWLIKKTPLNNG